MTYTDRHAIISRDILICIMHSQAHNKQLVQRSLLTTAFGFSRIERINRMEYVKRPMNIQHEYNFSFELIDTNEL